METAESDGFKRQSVGDPSSNVRKTLNGGEVSEVDDVVPLHLNLRY
jgi:hypothetical protein